LELGLGLGVNRVAVSLGVDATVGVWLKLTIGAAVDDSQLASSTAAATTPTFVMGMLWKRLAGEEGFEPSTF